MGKKLDDPLDIHIIFKSQGKDVTDDATKLLMKNIGYFRKLNGWTHKKTYLMGAAAMVGKTNPNLVEQIANYIAGEPPEPFVSPEVRDEQ